MKLGPYLGGILAPLLLGTITACAGSLTISNKTGQDIFNILVTSPKKEFFLRLDLLPNGTDSVEIPGITADLRVDTGLELWTFKTIPLSEARNFSFYPGNPPYLELTETSGKTTRMVATVRKMVPGKGSSPVCTLESFHPAMTMKEVCSILPDEAPRDDNGAVLTGLGFAGITWAARLIPARDDEINDNSLLEHLELRRPLDATDTEKLFAYLFREGYIPWQAEFPGRESEFGNTPPTRSEEEILNQSRQFMAAQKNATHADHASGKKCAEAIILLAPKNMIPQLAAADEPESDVQIFTVTLRPCTGVLLVDVAAYRKSPD